MDYSFTYSFSGKVDSFEFSGVKFWGIEGARDEYWINVKCTGIKAPVIATIELIQKLYDGEAEVCKLKTEAVITTDLNEPIDEEGTFELVKVAMEFSRRNLISILEFEYGVFLNPVPALPSDEEIAEKIMATYFSPN